MTAVAKTNKPLSVFILFTFFFPTVRPINDILFFCSEKDVNKRCGEHAEKKRKTISKTQQNYLVLLTSVIILQLLQGPI